MVKVKVFCPSQQHTEPDSPTKDSPADNYRYNKSNTSINTTKIDMFVHRLN
ncbi:MAG: hypothetical protein LBQ66_04880 [Planctomycetaceae bacterium]|nr:hypothetical protein [Planctomycetaceae bacterium]